MHGIKIDLLSNGKLQQQACFLCKLISCLKKPSVLSRGWWPGHWHEWVDCMLAWTFCREHTWQVSRVGKRFMSLDFWESVQTTNNHKHNKQAKSEIILCIDMDCGEPHKCPVADKSIIVTQWNITQPLKWGC